MKIYEERECCQNQDIVENESLNDLHLKGLKKIFHCKYCNKHFIEESYTDAAGSIDYRFVPLKFGLEPFATNVFEEKAEND